MANNAKVASAPVVLPNELTIRLSPQVCVAEYIGNRAMLEAECPLPEWMQWPKGFDRVFWQAGNFEYRLCRYRPDGANGPTRSFYEIDWWQLRWESIDRPNFYERNIREATAALEKALLIQTPAYREEESRRVNHYLEAKTDEKFQAFKACIPGLVQPKRARRAKVGAVDQAGGNAPRHSETQANQGARHV